MFLVPCGCMKLKPYTEDKNVNVIIETPYKSRNKFDYDKKTGLYKFHKLLPAGLAFPCDMGFIPGTLGQDGDPLDALIFMDEITYPGCLVECRVFGVIVALQKEGRNEFRNDRFLTVPANVKEYDHLNKVEDFNQNKLDDVVEFFKNYNKQAGKDFTLVEIAGPKKAHTLIKKGKK